MAAGVTSTGGRGTQRGVLQGYGERFERVGLGQGDDAVMGEKVRGDGAGLGGRLGEEEVAVAGG